MVNRDRTSLSSSWVKNKPIFGGRSWGCGVNVIRCRGPNVTSVKYSPSTSRPISGLFIRAEMTKPYVLAFTRTSLFNNSIPEVFTFVWHLRLINYDHSLRGEKVHITMLKIHFVGGWRQIWSERPCCVNPSLSSSRSQAGTPFYCSRDSSPLWVRTVSMSG